MTTFFSGQYPIFVITLGDLADIREILLLTLDWSSFHIGIVYYDLQRDHEVSDLRLGKRVTRHVFTVEEILQFPDEYHTKGVLSLPYGDIVEPFEAWYSNNKKMSRIDYYNGKNTFKLNCFPLLLDLF